MTWNKVNMQKKKTPNGQIMSQCQMSTSAQAQSKAGDQNLAREENTKKPG